MSYYTSNIKSWVISPVFDKSQIRSEFRLASNALFTSGLRLLNIGVIESIPTNGGPVRYNYLAGNGSHIKNMYLMDGKVVLDQVLNFQALEAFKRYNKPNSVNCDVNKIIHQNGLGFVYDRQVETPAIPPVPANPNATPPTPAIPGVPAVSYDAMIKEFYPNAPNAPTQSESTTPKGYLNLNEVFPILKSLLFLDTNLFSNLTVVIEYINTNVLTEQTNAVVNGTTQPILVADEVMDPVFAQKVAKEFKGVSWNTMELETVQLSAGTAGTVQNLNWKLLGFNNKTLNRLLVQKAGFNGLNVSELYGALGSEAMINEKFQVIVNGSNLLPNDGITGPNMALDLLTSTFGNLNSIPCSNDAGFYKANVLVENTVARLGHLSYYGVVVGSKIQNLQVSYSRTMRTNGATQYGQPLQFNFFGEVSKSLVPTKDGYLINYQ